MIETFTSAILMGLYSLSYCHRDGVTWVRMSLNEGDINRLYRWLGHAPSAAFTSRCNGLGEGAWSARLCNLSGWLHCSR